ncbi:CoA transferase [Azospirillum sp. B506]|uniref:CoA transferase n=1 Tax=Azospirillum sp. B506 TaxID=137721 RepID=UPI000A027AB0|nr:CoA transferase [Azospirillum sp. B506]
MALMNGDSGSPQRTALAAIWRAAGGDSRLLASVGLHGEGNLPSVFAVSALSTAAMAAAGLAVAEFKEAAFGQSPSVTVDHRLASLWFGTSVTPLGWSLPPVWDPIAGDYEAKDGWIRLHTNAAHHRDAALRCLGAPPDRDAVAAAVRRWSADGLESAIVGEGGCAAAMRDLASWRSHPQGQAVAREPLLWFEAQEPADADQTPVRPPALPERPLAGVKVLDLTRVLAGPTATRFLAGFGAEVLRIDPPWWDEPPLLPEMTLGKRRTRLDLRDPGQRDRFTELLSQADLLVHGYRADALDRMGLDPAARQRIRPGLVDVSLDAYGWTGPWRNRRGFDSLVQMSGGIAAEGMRRHGGDRPGPLPVQALDHAAGYLLATAAMRGLTLRLSDGRGSCWRTSLARVATLLTELPSFDGGPPLATAATADFKSDPEETAWGPALRLKPAVTVEGSPIRWERQAGPLGTDEARW